MVKDELNSEEKFFEKAVITEKFIKKYKKAIIFSVIAIALVIGANFAYEMNEQNKRDVANKSLKELQTNAKDAKALAELEKVSPNLYNVWILSQAIASQDIKALEKLQGSKTLIVSDLAKYQLAQDTKDVKALEEYSLKQDAIYKDLALVQSAVLLIKDGKVQKAHEALSKVQEDSSLNKIAKLLLHYGVK